MAVQEQTPYIEHIANGVTTSFALEFECKDKEHLIVLVDNVEPNVGTWSLVNGAVVFGIEPENGKIITIQRNTPFRRDTNFQSYDNSLRPATINKDFDWIWYKLQELGVADWILSTRINDLRAYVERQDSVLQENIDNLKTYVDDRDDELRAYLLEEIRKQGVALDQLEDYYNYLMQRLAQIAVDKGWDASFVVDASGETQQQVNYNGGAKWHSRVGGYQKNERVVLANGDIVKSTINGNTNNPNSDMTGWVKPNSASQIFDESGLSQQEINNKNNTISHVALMLDSPVVSGKIFNVLSRDEPNFALLKPYAGGGLFRWDASSTEIPDGGTVFAHNTVSGGRFLRIIDSDVKVSWFAGHGWTGQDKTVRVQQVIDFANNITRTSKLIVDSLYTITSTLFIDRETNQTSGEFYVESGSDGAGFQINSPITMFSSRLPYKPADAGSYTKAACSEFTYFRDISFLSTIKNIDCLVFDDKFLRLTFKDCIFNRVQAVKDAEYLQSILFDGCRIRQHVGFFLNTRDAYELRSYGHKFEDTQQGFRFYGIARGCHIDDGLFQGSVGPLVEAAGFFGSSVDKNYFEANDGQCIKIGVDGGLNLGFSINNNFFICHDADVANPYFYPVDIGYAVSCSISGNNSNTQIVNTDRANSFGISATGNGANGKNVLSIDAKKATSMSAVDTTDQALAPQIDRTKVIISDATGLSPSIRLPKLKNLIISDSVTIVNRTSSTIQVFPATDERVQYVPYNEAAQISAHSTATFCKTDSDYWVFF